MILKKALASAALLVASTLMLSGCMLPTRSETPAGSLADSASSQPTPAAAATPSLNASGYLGGNAKPVLPAGDPGRVVVVSQAPLKPDDLGGGLLLFAFRNNTSKGISHVDFTATANAGGRVVASGQSQGTIPAQVQPGEAGFGYIFFEDASSIPASGTTYEFKVKTMPADSSFYNTAPLTVSQADNNGSSIIGAAVNKTGKPLSGPYDVQVYCFNGNAIADQIVDSATEDGDIDAGASVSFSTDLYDTSCGTFLVGVSGYFK